MGNKGSPGISSLAKVLSDRARQEGSNAPRNSDLDYGTINGDYSLSLNKFSRKIPKSDYHVLRHVSGEYMCLTNEIPPAKTKVDDGSHTHTGNLGNPVSETTHYHTIYYPKLQPGDRVLVAWVESEPVIIDVVTKFV